MSKRIGFVPAVFVLATVMAFNAHHAGGAEECLAAPTRDPPEGRHWYYHFDQAKNQKCWRLGEAGLPILPQPTGPIANRAGREQLALSRAERDALFQEFVRWKELHRTFDRP